MTSDLEQLEQDIRVHERERTQEGLSTHNQVVHIAKALVEVAKALQSIEMTLRGRGTP